MDLFCTIELIINIFLENFGTNRKRDFSVNKKNTHKAKACSFYRKLIKLDPIYRRRSFQKKNLIARRQMCSNGTWLHDRPTLFFVLPNAGCIYVQIKWNHRALIICVTSCVRNTFPKTTLLLNFNAFYLKLLNIHY